jgi:hypothetical protein
VFQAIEAALPTSGADRRKKLFGLARALKSIVPDASARELRLHVAEWHRRSKAVISAGFTDIWAEFLSGWERVKVPAGQGLIQTALARAQACDPPLKAVELYAEEHVRLLVSLCRELQRFAGDTPFFLDCRTAGRLVGVPHASAWRLLTSVFVADGFLLRGEKGTKATGKANEYRYIAD